MAIRLDEKRDGNINEQLKADKLHFVWIDQLQLIEGDSILKFYVFRTIDFHKTRRGR